MYFAERRVLCNKLSLCLVITDSYILIISSSVVDNGCFAVWVKDNS